MARARPAAPGRERSDRHDRRHATGRGCACDRRRVVDGSAASSCSSRARARGPRCGRASSAALVVLTGLALVVGPGLWRLANALVRGAARSHPCRRARRHGRAPARLGVADARARATTRRRSARGRAPRPHAGTRAARVVARQARARPNGTGDTENPDASLGEALEDVACRHRGRVRRADRSRAGARLPARRPRAAPARGARGDAQRGAALRRRQDRRLPRGARRRRRRVRARPWPRVRPGRGRGRPRRPRGLGRRAADPPRRRRPHPQHARRRAPSSSCRCPAAPGTM